VRGCADLKSGVTSDLPEKLGVELDSTWFESNWLGNFLFTGTELW